MLISTDERGLKAPKRFRNPGPRDAGLDGLELFIMLAGGADDGGGYALVFASEYGGASPLASVSVGEPGTTPEVLAVSMLSMSDLRSVDCRSVEVESKPLDAKSGGT
jgi:hypothetical protein